MARKKITTIEEAVEVPDNYQPEEPPRDDFAGDEQRAPAIERLADLMESGDFECISRIYREDTRQGAPKGREFIERVDDFVDEEYLAEKYGGGRYVIRYEWKQGGERKKTTIPFAISGDYRPKQAAPVPVAAVPQNNTLGAILGGLTADKVAGIVAAVQGLKAIFAPPPPPVDVTELIKALATPRQSVGDAVLIKALEGVNRPAPAAAPSILQQIKDIQEVKNILNDSAESAGGDTMDMIVKIGMQMLPAFLAKNGGNYQQAGAAVRENPVISGMIEKDPELLGEFCGAVRDKYGAQAARELAAGYGYDFREEVAEQPQTETKQTTTEQAAATVAGV